ncbi:MAG: 3-isopropylmalate dehydratase large subunit [Candidatus Aureabacteria bacterium]|nr:3-isopropylmalate dehydratase large subunit [Candidatus Auribacterota bacterium]
MGKTLYEKVLEIHTVAKLPSGHLQLFVGTQLLHEVTSPQAFAMIRERDLKVLYPSRNFATADHIIPTTSYQRPFADTVAEEMMQALEKNTADFRIRFFDLEKEEGGIVHVIGPEQGITQPGMTITCGDSHTSTHGAFGAIAFGIGTSQIRDVLATQTLSMEPLKVRQVRIEGKLNPGVYAKDVILFVINKLGVKGGVGYAYEFAGSTIEAMNMEERMTICNMAIEAGARVGYVNPDQKTYDYLKGKPYAPKDKDWDKAVSFYESVRTDPDARFDDTVVFQASSIEPMVTWGITPGQSVAVTGNIPLAASVPPGEQKLFKEALEYMSFTEGTPILGTPVDVAFIGSCTNGRLSDLEAAAEIVRGHQVKKGMLALVVPGSQKIKRQAEQMGLHTIFKEAGFEWREAGCSLCLAMNPDQLKGKQISASSSNRNFKGRQGSPTGRTLLMSPAMVACASIYGVVSDVRELIQERKK